MGLERRLALSGHSALFFDAGLAAGELRLEDRAALEPPRARE
jgi:hypothetical protein